MFNITDIQAFTFGFMGTLVIGFIIIIALLTKNDSPTKQRAQRLAIASSSAATLFIGASVGLIYAFVDTSLASFLAFPATILAVYLLLFRTANLYRFYGGKSESQEQSIKLIQLPTSIDAKTREQQTTLREKLRALPHFQETFEGDLVCLITGDLIRWSKYAGEPCLAIQVAGKVTISVCRFETLKRYVSLHERIATLFPSAGNLAMTAQEI